MRLIRILVLVRRRATALNVALTPKSAWGRVLYTSAVAFVLNDIAGRTFTSLFPDLSAVLAETVRRALPSAFVAGSVILALFAALQALVVLADASGGSGRPRRPKPSRGAVIRLILVLLAGAAIGLIDARLGANSLHRAGATDR